MSSLDLTLLDLGNNFLTKSAAAQLHADIDG